MANIFMMIFWLEEAKVRYDSCLLKEKERDWWEEVGMDMGDDVVDALSWDDFKIRFCVKFVPVIEVQ